MVPSLGMSILGLIVGGLGGLAASAFATQDSYAYTRNIVCLLLGGGAGAVAGAVIGGTHAVVEAIQRTRPSA
jgi:hypothetical protein